MIQMILGWVLVAIGCLIAVNSNVKIELKSGNWIQKTAFHDLFSGPKNIDSFTINDRKLTSSFDENETQFYSKKYVDSQIEKLNKILNS